MVINIYPINKFRPRFVRGRAAMGRYIVLEACFLCLSASCIGSKGLRKTFLKTLLLARPPKTTKKE